MTEHAQDRRIFVEAATPEAHAETVRTELGEAMATIERVHGRPFEGPIRIYICATQRSYNDRTGAPKLGRARGAVFGDCVFLSPRTFDTQTCRKILTHELSHLHFRQIIGTAYTTGIPGWFQEGLAVYASDGGGAEAVPEDRARDAILAGDSIDPEDTGASFPRMSAAHGLKHHMFYRQSGMFVRYLAESRPAVFERFISRLYKGISFADAFESAYEMPVSEAWDEYRAWLESAEPNNGPEAREPKGAALPHHRPQNVKNNLFWARYE